MQKEKIFGLIGYPLGHSFSKQYFDNLFNNLGLDGYSYLNFPIKSISELNNLLKQTPNLIGLNVTSPYKQEVIPYINHLSPAAKEINSVNCIKINNNQLIGYNTDYIGFANSLCQSLDLTRIKSALILGTGGGARAVAYALKTLNISYQFVSRTPSPNTLNYEDLSTKGLSEYNLIINATPCGLEKYPSIAPIDTNQISNNHIVYDLIYNPSMTLLLQKAKKQGAKILNGYQMLINQAEENWKIWQDYDF